MRTRVPTTSLLPAVLAGLLLAGCGGDGASQAGDGADDAVPSDGSSVGQSASPAALPQPQCSEVWVTGATLPAGYELCYDGEARVAPDGAYCEVGKPLVTHAGRWWAVRGGEVQEATTDGRLVEDPGYAADLRTCRG
ncbi:hypothetical protein [Nocardioides perillae]|uniref:Lipoprotein n=1 Tax=Nocardioides perillae TaxID=1119534 RepID=A0A7Y9RRH0_9ACTN|nr:hypothetical protein [Nocardioides perillae]NYG55222.1 hypothetical protein [Nocardioides perillae]